MVGAGIAAHDHQAAGVAVVRVGVAGRPTAELRDHRLYRGGVAEPRAVVNVIGAHQQADELLLHIAVFVGGLGRGERAERAAVLGKFLCHQIQRLIPGRLGEDAVLADQWRGQAIIVLDEGEAKASLHAQHPLAGLVSRVVEHVDETVSARLPAS